MKWWWLLAVENMRERDNQRIGGVGSVRDCKNEREVWVQDFGFKLAKRRERFGFKIFVIAMQLKTMCSLAWCGRRYDTGEESEGRSRERVSKSRERGVRSGARVKFKRMVEIQSQQNPTANINSIKYKVIIKTI